nr:MAG TPA: hypothetical protein [Caudoviricetes sp.]
MKIPNQSIYQFLIFVKRLIDYTSKQSTKGASLEAPFGRSLLQPFIRLN